MWDIHLNNADGDYLAGFNDGSSLQCSCVSDAMLSVEQKIASKGLSMLTLNRVRAYVKKWHERNDRVD